MTKDEIDNALRSWHTINKALKTMSEQDCKAVKKYRENKLNSS